MTTLDARTDGERFDLTGEFLTRRSLDCEGDRIHRLLVDRPTGERLAVLVAPGRDSPLGLRTGGVYHFSGLVRATPVRGPGDRARECPDCGGPLRPGRALDRIDRALAPAAVRLGLTEPFAVADRLTTVRSVEQSDGDDDGDGDGDGGGDREGRRRAEESGRVAERPFRRGNGERALRVRAPDYVCDACGRHVDGVQREDERGVERDPDRE